MWQYKRGRVHELSFLRVRPPGGNGCRGGLGKERDRHCVPVTGRQGLGAEARMMERTSLEVTSFKIERWSAVNGNSGRKETRVSARTERSFSELYFAKFMA